MALPFIDPFYSSRSSSSGSFLHHPYPLRSSSLCPLCNNHNSHAEKAVLQRRNSIVFTPCYCLTEHHDFHTGILISLFNETSPFTHRVISVMLALVQVQFSIAFLYRKQDFSEVLKMNFWFHYQVCLYLPDQFLYVLQILSTTIYLWLISLTASKELSILLLKLLECR